MAQGFSREPGTHGPLEEVPKRAARKITVWAAAIALGGFLFGFDTGVISGALLYIRGTSPSAPSSRAVSSACC